MTISTGNDVYYDPYDIVLNADPYPMFRRLREEAPLYYNEQHDFYALSRFADVDKGLVDHVTFSSARGIILELVKANLDIPPGLLIMVTSFTRFAVALSFLRAGLGLQTTPANLVLISLALFMTFYVMAPTFDRAWETGVQPLMKNEI